MLIYCLPQPLRKYEKDTSRCVFVLKYGCFPKSQGNGSVHYIHRFESLDLRPDGVVVKE